jgi:hypothetical protein
MKREGMLAVAVLVATALMAAPADARMVVQFDTQAALLQSGRLLRVKGPVGCSRTERMAIRVTVTQRAAGAVAEGWWRGLCRVRRATWTAREVGIQGRQVFRAGRAQACALGTTRRAGRVTEAHQWCETIRLVVSASAR